MTVRQALRLCARTWRLRLLRSLSRQSEQSTVNDELRILILEDNPSDAELVKLELRRAGFAFTARLAQDWPSFRQSLDESTPDSHPRGLFPAGFRWPGRSGSGETASPTSR